MHKFVIVGLVVALACFSPVARADFEVWFRDSLTGTWNLEFTVTPMSVGATTDIILEDANTGTWRIGSTNPSVDVLGDIEITGELSRPIDLLIGGSNAQGFNPLAPTIVAGCKHWRGTVFEGNADVHLIASVGDTIGSTSGSELISVHNVARIEAGVQIGTPDHYVTLSNDGPDRVFKVAAPDLYGSVRSFGGDITVICGNVVGSVRAFNDANIDLIQVVDGFYGSIITSDGDIERIQGTHFGGTNAAEGLIESGGGIEEILLFGSLGAREDATLGVVNQPATVRTLNGDIEELTAGGSIVGVLDVAGDVLSCNAGYIFAGTNPNFVPAVWIVDGFVGTVTIANNALWDLTTSSVTNISIGTDFGGTITLTEGLPATSTIEIGDNLVTGAELIFDNDANDPDDVGLAGQVVINQNDMSNSWQGTVRITGTNSPTDDVVLSGALYAPTPPDIGGGSVGEVPFSIHREASEPAHGSADPTSCNNGAGAALAPCQGIIGFYGPVTGQGGAGVDFRVLGRGLDPLAPWVDISDQFTALFGMEGGRAVHLIPVVYPGGLVNGAEYRITPKSTVECVIDGGASGIPADDARSLQFKVPLPPCSNILADITADGVCDVASGGDGTVNLTDFSCYLNLWAGDDAAADITGSGVCTPGSGGNGVDLSDFSCYLSLWAEPCA